MISEHWLAANRITSLRRSRRKDARAESLIAENVRKAIKYQNGYRVRRDYVRAKMHWKMAAEMGDPSSQHALACYLEYGVGGRRNRVAAARWYRESASQGFIDGLHGYAVCLFEGSGVKPDAILALRIFRRLASLGDAYSICWLGYCYRFGPKTIVDQRKAVKWFRRAAGMADVKVDALFMLGEMYARGIGVAASSAMAKRYYRLAVENGDKGAAKALRELRG